MRKILLRSIYKNVDLVLSPGKASDAYFSWAGLLPDQIIRAVHSIDNSRFEDDRLQDSVTCNFELQATQWRRELGIAETATVFLFAGKFESVKNPEILINAFLKISKTNNNIHLIMLGNGTLDSKLKLIFDKQFDNSHIKSTNISFVPFQNQSAMPTVYRLCDVFILPSISETWGLAVNEAMACGKPVIVSDKCGCAQELVVEGVNGYTFKSGSAADLISKMQLMLDRTDLKSMGESSKQIISTFNYGTFSEALDQCFAKLKM
jgi:glycosyltransferase involved in cell wall biosynthesis